MQQQMQQEQQFEPQIQTGMTSTDKKKEKNNEYIEFHFLQFDETFLKSNDVMFLGLMMNFFHGIKSCRRC